MLCTIEFVRRNVLIMLAIAWIESSHLLGKDSLWPFKRKSCEVLCKCSCLNACSNLIVWDNRINNIFCSLFLKLNWKNCLSFVNYVELRFLTTPSTFNIRKEHSILNLVPYTLSSQCQKVGLSMLSCVVFNLNFMPLQELHRIIFIWNILATGIPEHWYCSFSHRAPLERAVRNMWVSNLHPHVWRRNISISCWDFRACHNSFKSSLICWVNPHWNLHSSSLL